MINWFPAPAHEEELVEQRRDQSAGDGRRPVEELRFVDAARDCWSERASRVHRRPGKRADRQNIGGNRESDRQSSDLWPAQIDNRSEDYEYQKERRDRFQRECLAPADVERDRLTSAACGDEDGLGKARFQRVTGSDRSQQL